ncbi:MAG: PfkB family carbohydrate kinase [Solirubrobacterales bacterium]
MTEPRIAGTDGAASRIAGAGDAASRIAVAGNINADITCRLPRPPLPGETLLAEELELGPGGKAANAAVALARLGAQPLLIGSVGEDPLGSLVLAALEREGVASGRIVRHADALTGVASVFVASHGENAIVTHLGANLSMSAQELPDLEGCGALLMTLGLPRGVLLALVARARAVGARIVLDATPLRDLPLPAELLAVDVLSANRVEAEQLIGRAIESLDGDDVRSACAELCALGARSAVLKLGKEGAAWIEGSRQGHVAAPEVEVVDSTGAGDAFMAALTLRLVAGASLPAAVEFACLVGALSTTGSGAQGGWATPADVRRFAAAVGP